MGRLGFSPSSPPLEVHAVFDQDLGLGLCLAWRLLHGRCFAPGLNGRFTVLVSHFTAQACVTGVPERKENVGPTPLPFEKGGSGHPRGSSADPGWQVDDQLVSDLGADPATGQLAAGACLPGLTWRRGREQGRGRRQGAA